MHSQVSSVPDQKIFYLSTYLPISLSLCVYFLSLLPLSPFPGYSIPFSLSFLLPSCSLSGKQKIFQRSQPKISIYSVIILEIRIIPRPIANQEQ